jgi:predicted GIY-YIG superfamily endonuclease
MSDTSPTPPPVQVVWFEEFLTREEAKFVEAHLEKWSRRKTEALIGVEPFD